MSGIEVAATVASIIAAFGSGMNVLKRVRVKQKARKQDKQTAKITQDELRVQQSLLRGPQQIRAEYDKNVTRLGHRFEIGDAIAHDSLAHTLIVLNTGLVNILNHALSGDSKAHEMSKRSLLGLSELAAADTINALGQLNKRLDKRLDKRFASASSFAVQPKPQLNTPHRRKRKASKQKEQALVAPNITPPTPKEKNRPEADPLARGGWVRSKSGTSVVSSGSSTPRPSKQSSNHSSFSLAKDLSPSHLEPTAPNPRLTQSNPICPCGTHVLPPQYEIEKHRHHPQSHTYMQLQEPDVLLASPDAFSADFVPPRPPKIPLERPVSTRKPRPPSVATFLTASTKIGEIPEHRWLDRHLLPWDNRPLPYVIPPPLEPEPAKRKARGFKSWWKSHGRTDSNTEKELYVG